MDLKTMPTINQKLRIPFYLLTIIFISAPSIICAYNFTDAIQSISPNRQGTNDGILFLNTLKKMLETNQSTSEVNKLAIFWKDSVKQFDFSEIYHSPFLKPLENDYRGVLLQGYHRKNHYQLTLPLETDEKIPVMRLGDFKLSFALKQNKTCVTGDRSYSGYLNTNIALKQFSYKTLAALLEGLMNVIDPHNMASLTPKESFRFEEVEGSSRKAINVFNQTYPHFQKLMDDYFCLHSVLQTKNFQNTPFTHFKLVMSFDFSNMRKKYRYLVKQLQRLENLFQFRVTFQNKHGNHLMGISLDSQEKFIYLDFYTHQGKIIPYSPERQPIFKEAFSLTKLVDFDFTMNIDFFLNIYGMKLRANRIRVDCLYQSRKQYGKVIYKLKEIPKTMVTGRAYYILPPWFIDFLIPGNIELLIDNFFKVLVTANDDKGSIITLHWDTRKPNNVFFHPQAISEFIDNSFIQFGFKIWQEKFSLTEKASSDLHRLNRHVLEAIILDLSKNL